MTRCTFCINISKINIDLFGESYSYEVVPVCFECYCKIKEHNFCYGDSACIWKIFAYVKGKKLSYRIPNCSHPIGVNCCEI